MISWRMMPWRNGLLSAKIIKEMMESDSGDIKDRSKNKKQKRFSVKRKLIELPLFLNCEVNILHSTFQEQSNQKWKIWDHFSKHCTPPPIQIIKISQNSYGGNYNTSHWSKLLFSCSSEEDVNHLFCQCSHRKNFD